MIHTLDRTLILQFREALAKIVQDSPPFICVNTEEGRIEQQKGYFKTNGTPNPLEELTPYFFFLWQRFLPKPNVDIPLSCRVYWLHAQQVQVYMKAGFTLGVEIRPLESCFGIDSAGLEAAQAFSRTLFENLAVKQQTIGHWPFTNSF